MHVVQDAEQRLAALERERKSQFHQLQRLFENLDADESGEIDAEEIRKIDKLRGPAMSRSVFLTLGGIVSPRRVESKNHDHRTPEPQTEALDPFLPSPHPLSV